MERAFKLDKVSAPVTPHRHCDYEAWNIQIHAEQSLHSRWPLYSLSRTSLMHIAVTQGGAQIIDRV